MNYALALAVLLIFAGCSTPKIQNDSCLTDEEVKIQQTQMQDFLKRNSAPGSDWKLEKATCEKRFYTYGTGHVLIYRDALTKKVPSRFGEVPFQQADAACLNAAMEEIRSLKIDYTERILTIAQKTYGPAWQDPDVGAGSWLSCGKRESSPHEFLWSVDLFIHELDHAAMSTAGKYCSYYPWSDRQDCDVFNTPDQALQSLQVNKNWPGVAASGLEGLLRVQELYLGNAKSALAPMILLDELRAYTVGTEVFTAMLKLRGKAIYDKEKRRPTVLPHIALIDLVKRYRIASLAQDPAFAKSNGAKIIDETLAVSEKALNAWLKETKKQNEVSKATVSELAATKAIRSL